MKRETKKVKKPVKRVRKPVAKPVEEEVTFIWHPPVAPEQKKIGVTFPEVWNEELARAAKVLGGDPLEVITKLMAFLPTHYPNHLLMLEAIVAAEKETIPEEIKRWQDLEQEAYLTGRKLANEKDARLGKITEEIAERRKIIEPETSFAERETIVRETTYLNPRHGVGYCKS